MNNKKPIGLVADNGADLPQEFIDKNQIEVVFHQVYFPNEGFSSVDKINSCDFCKKAREMKEKNIFPKTSFAAMGAFKDAYQKALEKYEKILAVIVTAKHSGAFNSASQAKSLMEEGNKIEVIDSALISTGQGILVVKIQELIDQNKSVPEILESVKLMKEKIRFFGFLEDYSWLKSGGRIPGRLIDIMEAFQKRGVRMALGMKDGKLGVRGIKFLAKDRVKAIVKELAKKKGISKIAIAHADALPEAQRLKTELEKIGKEILYVTDLTPVLIAHGGPGALIVSYYSE